MIRLWEDLMGGGYIDDFYNLYPIIEGEALDERRERLAQIKLDELKEKMKNDLEKRNG